MGIHWLKDSQVLGLLFINFFDFFVMFLGIAHLFELSTKWGERVKDIQQRASSELNQWPLQEDPTIH